MQALIVDDSRTIRSVLGKMLQKMGCEVREAENGLQALKHLEAGYHPAVALVDWNMPEMNGYEFVQAVRANNQFDDLNLMMVTTESDMERIIAALEAGANEYVMKPFTQDVILEKLRLLGLDEAST